MVELIKDIAVKAGQKILEIYNREDFSGIVDFKADNSPLTLADKESHNVIVAELEKAFPEIPVLSEEGKDIPYEERKNWTKFWCVDPLDGTKEFIKKNGEFTVNIALIENNTPVLGVIYAPVPNILYSGVVSKGAQKQEGTDIKDIRVNTKQKDYVAVGSRSHAAPEEQNFLSKLPVSGLVSVGSSLKFCMVAEGKADVYFRFGPTMEWDTAAGQAIVEAAGGKVLNEKFQPFTYNKESLRNGSFYCLAEVNLDPVVTE
ncbi:MAG TPA: 3'(2'),5'-bisphosphate nucleotidase CysQ [Cytophagaceae bacterium]